MLWRDAFFTLSKSHSNRIRGNVHPESDGVARKRLWEIPEYAHGVSFVASVSNCRFRIQKKYIPHNLERKLVRYRMRRRIVQVISGV